jgi:hypothetical protein
MDEIAQEYDVIVLGTGTFYFPSLSPPLSAIPADGRRIPASPSFN